MGEKTQLACMLFFKGEEEEKEWPKPGRRQRSRWGEGGFV